VEHFECDRPVVPEVVREKHGGHATPAQLAVESVSVSQAALELIAEVCHAEPVVNGTRATPYAYEPP
jgi:hypothetical protein